jgi:hypothetical protein
MSQFSEPQTSGPTQADPDRGPLVEAQAGAAQAADQAREKAQQAAGQAQERMREQLNQRSSQVASQIGEQASDLRSVGASLREQGKDGPAKAAERIADYAEKVSGYLSQKDPDGMLADAEDLGRRQPWAFAAGGLALGFAASRFLKASSRQRHRSRPPTVSRPAGVFPRPDASVGNGSSGASRPSPVGPSTGTVI